MKTVLTAVAVVAVANSALAIQIAGEDFDGGALNLSSSSVANMDGGPGDWFGVGEIASWPGSGGVPFSIADDSVVGVSGSPFASDTEGVFGQNRDRNDAFFGISDSDEFGAGQTASWTFDTSGFQNFQFSVDFGGLSDSSFGGYTLGATFINFEIIVDGSSVGSLRFDAIANTAYVMRNMDSGATAGGGAELQASGLGVTKFSAETGLAVADLISDKATVDTGELDSFVTGVFAADGDEVEIVLTANVPFEAAAFDNLQILGEVPAPGSAALLGVAGLVAARRRRA